MNVPDKNIFIKDKHKLDPRVCRKLWPEFFDYLQSNYPDKKFSERLWIFYNGPHEGCLKCGKPTRYINFCKGYCNHCSNCAGLVRAENARKTIQDKYGTHNMAYIPGVTEKTKQTKIKKYGDAGYNNHTKAVQTCLERYGGFGHASEAIKKKSQQTRLKKYGDPTYTNRQKCKETCMLRYGVEYSSQINSMKEQSKITKLNRYGDPTYTNRQKSIDTYRQTQISKKDFLIGYTDSGKWICKCPDRTCNLCDKKQYITPGSIYLNRIYQNTETCTIKFPIGSLDGGVSQISKTFFEKITNTHNYEVYTEYKVGPYRIDYYIPELNVAIEFNGDYWHANPKIYNEGWIHPLTGLTAEQIWMKDLERMDYLMEQGIDVKVVWESDMLNYASLNDILNQ